jgi:hypothetical protein
MSIKQQIRVYLRHGHGSRRVDFTPRAEVMVTGSPDDPHCMGSRGWRRVGYVRGVLREIRMAEAQEAA